MKFEMYELSITGYMLRFGLMMMMVILGVMLHQYYLLVITPVVFLSMMLGVKMTMQPEKVRVVQNSKLPKPQ